VKKGLNVLWFLTLPVIVIGARAVINARLRKEE
jgi:hypothetical protein